MNLFAQKDENIHFEEFVKAFYDKSVKKPLCIYDGINGTIVDTLKIIEAENSWYKISIIHSEYGWFKIKSIQRLPNAFNNYKHENHWVKTSNFLISVNIHTDHNRVYLYDEPTKKSNRIHKMDSLQPVQIIETNGLWAMVRFTIGKKTVNGWLSFKDQCAHPWTNCPKYK